MLFNIAAILIIPEFIKNPKIGFQIIYYYIYSITLKFRYKKYSIQYINDIYILDENLEKEEKEYNDIIKYCLLIKGSLNTIIKYKQCFIYKYIISIHKIGETNIIDYMYNVWVPKHIKTKEQLNQLLYEKSDNNIYTTLDEKFTEMPSKPFISNSYKKIGEIIQKLTNIKIANCNISTPSILINGPPGLGKTFIYKYLYFLKFSKTINIYYVNCLKCEDFNEFIAKLESKTFYNNIFIIDEIDKYFDFLCSKTDKDGRLIYNRIDLLTKLMNFIDCDPGTKIFCTNNFDTLFKGNEIHFDALKSRFMSIDMKPYNTEDIIGFYKFINENLKETDYYMDNQKLDSILEKLKSNITNGLPRKLNQILISNEFDFNKAVDEINIL